MQRYYHTIAVTLVIIAGSAAVATVTYAVASTSPPGAPLALLTQSPNPTAPSQPYTVSWSSANATSCTLKVTAPNGVTVNPWGVGISGSKQPNYTITGDYFISIDCTGTGGTVHQEIIHVVANPPPPPSASFTQSADTTVGNGTTG